MTVLRSNNSSNFHRLNKFKLFLIRVYQNLTVEPAFFVISSSQFMLNATISQMVIFKSCVNDFPEFKETFGDQLEDFCQNDLVNDVERNQLVNSVTADFNAKLQIVHSVIPCLLSFFAGAWIDRFGRKLILFSYLALLMVESVIFIILSIKLDSKKEWIYLPELPTSMMGGYGIFMAALISFIDKHD